MHEVPVYTHMCVCTCIRVFLCAYVQVCVCVCGEVTGRVFVDVRGGRAFDGAFVCTIYIQGIRNSPATHETFKSLELFIDKTNLTDVELTLDVVYGLSSASFHRMFNHPLLRKTPLPFSLLLPRTH